MMASEAAERDMQAIKADHKVIQQEIEKLRTLTLPLVAKASKPHSQTCTAPQSDLAGPGRYNVTGELGKSQTLSLYRSSPRLTIPLAGCRGGSQQAFWPSPGTYTPKVDFSHRSQPSFSFGHKDAKRLCYLEEIARRSPGPVYSPAPSSTPGGKIAGSKRETYRQFLRNDFPSPQHYYLMSAGATISGRFGKSAKSDYMKEYIPGIERYLKGKSSEFTANLPSVRPRNCASLKSQGHLSLLDGNWSNPGVGTYSALLPVSAKNQFSFSKAPRTTRIPNVP